LDPLYKDEQQDQCDLKKDIDGCRKTCILMAMQQLSLSQAQILDIGTGRFPGIPLVFPGKFLLAVALQKTKVVDAVVETLELKNVTTQHPRVKRN
jgi:16S rRNA G527 N7-methylase RsmG